MKIAKQLGAARIAAKRKRFEKALSRKSIYFDEAHILFSAKAAFSAPCRTGMTHYTHQTTQRLTGLNSKTRSALNDLYKADSTGAQP